MTMGEWLKLVSPKDAGEFGSLLSGIGALAAAGVGLWLGLKAIPDQMKAWRAQQRDQRKADAAGRAVVAARHFGIALRTLASDVSTVATPDPAPDASGGERRAAAKEGFERDWSNRLTLLTPDFNEYLRQWSANAPFLPKNIDALLKEGWELRASILASAKLHAMHLGGDWASADERIRTYEGTMGAKIEHQIAEWEAKVEAVVLPLARLDV